MPTSSLRSTAFAPSDFIVRLGESDEEFSLSGMADLAQTHQGCPWTGTRRSGLVRFDMANNLDQPSCLRQQDRLEKLDRMHLVGGGKHLGGGVPAILESDRIGSRLTPQDLGHFVWERK